VEYLMQLQQKVPDGRKPFMRRIISSGDDVTIVCNARQALEIAKVYFESLEQTNREEDQNYSACMGIAVFHAHAPFAAVYEIAEQCCESGKKRMKKLKLTDACYIDAYFCQSAITGDLETLRERTGKARTCMPYCLPDGLDKFEAIGKELSKINRGNVKALRDAAFRSQVDFEMELMRVQSNCKEALAIDKKCRSEEDRAKLRAMLCDVCTFYDLWFGGEANG